MRVTKHQMIKKQFKQMASVGLSVLALNYTLPTSAGSLNLDLRFDSDSSSYNTAAKTANANNKATTKNYVNVGRLDFKGKLNEELNFRLRYRFDRDDKTTVNATDGLTSQVDLAYISHKLVDGLTLTLGKFNSELGSVEGNTPIPELYLRSQTYNQINTNGFIFTTGAKLNYTFDVHEFNVLLLNQSESTTTEQSKVSYGLVYKSSLMNKTLLPSVSYLKDEKQSLAGVDSKKSMTLTSAGLKWDPKPYYLSVDYILFDYANVSAADQKEKYNSLVAEFAYDFDGLIPKVKFENSQKKAEVASGSSTTKYEGLGLGFEYRPFNQDTFRYHVMLTQIVTKPDGGDSQLEQHFIVGTKILADFLK